MQAVSGLKMHQFEKRMNTRFNSNLYVGYEMALLAARIMRRMTGSHCTVRPASGLFRVVRYSPEGKEETD